MTDAEERPSAAADGGSERREVGALRVLNGLAREILSEPPLSVALHRVVEVAKALLRADFSAILLLRPGSGEITHFAYDAPRELFPPRLPRLVGLLAAPVLEQRTVRLDDIRGHPDGVGIPVDHPQFRR